MNKWWGYEHVNGSLQAKRYFDERDLTEARESAFVALVVGPFNCNTREEALRRIAEALGTKS